MNTKGIHLSRFNQVLLSVILLPVLLNLGKLFLVPLAIAAFFAMLLFPVTLRLQRLGLKKSGAALGAVLLLVAIIGALNAVVYFQVQALDADLPQLEERIAEKTNRLQWLLSQTTDLSRYEQEAILEEKTPDIVKAITKMIKNLVVNSLYLLLAFFIVLTYTFFFLVYEHKLESFFVRLHLFSSQTESKVMLARISRIVYDYLKGTFLVIGILGVVYALGFWAIGIEHALLFALITALLRVVPYFGSFLGIAFPIAFAFLTKDSLLYPVAVLVFFMITQLLEANVLTPYITGAKVKLNPLATIMVILLGGLLWGVAGMILFVPLFGILKVIFDRVPALEPFGFFLGKDSGEAGVKS